MQERLSNKQQTKGLLILLIFVVLRITILKIENEILFLLSAFFTGSICLVYLGFTKWVKIDLRWWWRFSRENFMKDIIWGIFGFLTCFTSTSAIMLSALNYGFTSQNTTSNTVTVASYFQSLFLVLQLQASRRKQYSEAFYFMLLKKDLGSGEVIFFKH